MTYDNDALEKLVKDEFTPKTLLKKSPQKNSVDYTIVERFRSELAVIKAAILKDVFAFPSTQMAETYIQFHQKSLNFLLQQLLGYLDDAVLAKRLPLKPLYEAAIEEVEKLLNFIAQSFSQYFDIDQPVTESYRRVAVVDLRRKGDELSKMASLVVVDKNVIDLVLRSLDRLLDAGTTITYRNLRYYGELIDQVLRLLKQGEGDVADAFFTVINDQLNGVGLPEEALTIKLHMLLLKLNVNCREYIEYCTAALYYKIKDKPIPQKLSILTLYEKLMSQLHPKPDHKLLPDDMGAVEQIKNWITAERDQLETGIDSNRGPAKIPKQARVETLRLGISSSQLAVLIRMLVLLGVVDEDNESKICRTFVGIFEPRNGDQLSAEALRVKVSKPRPTAIETVQDLFLKGYNSLHGWLRGKKP
jgi:hypothetical protein